MKKLLIFLCVSFLFLRCTETASGSTPANEPLSERRVLLTREAARHIGTPYASPSSPPRTFDCSSFVSHVFAQLGYSLPRVSFAYAYVGTRIDWRYALPGDILVFSRTRGSPFISHVAILWERCSTGNLAGSSIIHSASINTGRSMLQGNTVTRTGVVVTQLGLRADGIIENEYFFQRFKFVTRVLRD